MALSKLTPVLDLPALPDKPYHPGSNFNFPKREFGKKQIVKRCCQLAWFGKWKWLHYSEQDDVVFCHVCVTALRSKRMKMNRGDTAFVSKGFSNWKCGTVGFKNHEASACHKEAMQMVVVLPNCCPDIGEMLSREYIDKKKTTGNVCLRFCQTSSFWRDKACLFVALVIM